MSLHVEELGLRLQSDWIAPHSRCFRPPSWPPPRNWVVSEDRDGNVLSLWGDPTWNLSPWAGKSGILDFGDGPIAGKADPLDAANADLMRLAATWYMWGPRAAATVNTLKASFLPIRRIAALCSRNGIVASDLMRFPRVLEQVPLVISPSEYGRTILELHRLWDARDEIGFVIAGPEEIKRLVAASPQHEIGQTAYIPPRIWTYQVQRLRGCLEEFHAHRKQVEDCFHFCVDAYAHNFGSLAAAMNRAPRSVRHLLPFQQQRRQNPGARGGVIRFQGPFELTAKRFGIESLLQRWVTIPAAGLDIRQFSSYLTLIQLAGLAYVANFTLQRINEVASLRADCLTWEMDPKLGRVPIICGETTKTDPDCDARWPTSPSVEVAVSAMSAVAHLRMRCAAAHSRVNPGKADRANPYLVDRALEPWSGNVVTPYSMRAHVVSYATLARDAPLLFDEDVMRITEEDLRVARMLTPSLNADRGFAVGEQWPLSWHQLRRTGAVNMFASGLLSDSSMQFQMKHASRLMPLYYGRGYTKLHLNEEVEAVVVAAMYEAMAHKLKSAMGERFVSPYGEDRKQAILVSLVGDKDAKALSAAARKGKTSFREIRLGACTKRGPCAYGGIESVARCAGGDGSAPCADALFDRAKEQQVMKELNRVDGDLAQTPAASPRHHALTAERNGLENFLDVVRR